MNKKILSFVALSLFLALKGGADEPCDRPLLTPLQIGAQTREHAIEVLKAGNVPSFLKATRNGNIPVFLLNKSTVAGTGDLLSESLATHVYYQPWWNNDHGGMRLTNYLIDVDTAGERGFGEINETGLSWRPIASYLPRYRPETTGVIVEVAYSLTPAEKEVAEYYQGVRRAAIIRVPFTFGGEQDLTLPNMLRGGEHCFIFCKAGQVGSHVAEINQKLQQMLGVSGPALMENEHVKVFLKAVRQKMLRVGIDELSPELTKYMKEQKELADILPAKMKPADKRIAMNWIIGYDASVRYQTLMRALGVSGDTGYRDMNNERASFVVIYDAMNKAQAFRDATYTTPGKFSIWGADGQVPLK